MRITGRQLRQIIKEELGKGIDWNQVGDAMWPEAVPALQAIWGKQIPSVDDRNSNEELEGLMIAIGSILEPSVKIWGDLGKVGNFILFNPAGIDVTMPDSYAQINAKLICVRAGLNLPMVGGWDAALQEQTADLLQKMIAGGGMRTSALAKRSVKTYPADNPAQAQTK